jgi:phosphoserine phosphatase
VSNNALLAPRLTAAEFHRAVLDLSPTVAVFDCDGTLWSGDSGSGFMNWSIETGLVSRDTASWIDARYRAYHRNEVSEYDICAQMVQMYHGLREDEVRAAARAFFPARVARNIFPEMRALVDDLLSRNVELWAVSSTNNWVIEEGVRDFGIPPSRVLAARVHISDGIVTNTILDVPTDERKAAALQRAGITHPDAVFGNSVHDAAMLAIARRAFPVNPTLALLDHSAQTGWPIFYPASVAPTPAA